jgi:hypothetical protein
MAQSRGQPEYRASLIYGRGTGNEIDLTRANFWSFLRNCAHNGEGVRRRGRDQVIRSNHFSPRLTQSRRLNEANCPFPRQAEVMNAPAIKNFETPAHKNTSTPPHSLFIPTTQPPPGQPKYNDEIIHNANRLPSGDDQHSLKKKAK